MFHRTHLILAAALAACSTADSTDTAVCDAALTACDASLEACEVDLAAAEDDECEDCDALVEELGCPTAVATPEVGGVAWSDDGKASIHLPPGALTEAATLTVTLVPAAVAPPELGSPVYDIGPDGKLAHAGTVCLPADHAKLEDACLGYLDERSGTWKCEDDCLAPVGEGTVCGETDHFTNFAVLLTGTKSGKGCDDDDTYFTGRWGGRAASEDDAAFVAIGPGALVEEAVITVKPGTNPIVDAKLASDVFVFAPAGTKFAAPVTVCLESTIEKAPEACLAYLDTSGREPAWKCEDPCLKQVDDQTWCGKTDHFTSFAILLGGGLSDDECAKQCL